MSHANEIVGSNGRRFLRTYPIRHIPLQRYCQWSLSHGFAQAAGTPEKKDANGKITPAEPGILTLAEKNEREQLRANLGYSGQLPPDVAFSPVDLAPKVATVQQLYAEQEVAREARAARLNAKHDLAPVSGRSIAATALFDENALETTLLQLGARHD